MAELLFEIGTEELPGEFMAHARELLSTLIHEKLQQQGLDHGHITAYVAPRRLAVYVQGVAEASPAYKELRRGPSGDVAYEESGALSQAALSFAAASVVSPEDLFLKETDKGNYLFAHIQHEAVSARVLLPEMLKELVQDFPAQRKMRWGKESVPFVRPIVWILALLDEQPLTLEIAGIHAGAMTYGHRFLAPDSLAISHPSQYVETLKEAYVLVDTQAREQAIWQAAQQASGDLTPEYSKRLLTEIASLVEYPFAVMGRFERNYLELPDEVLATTMMHYQRYIPLRDVEGQLSNAFISISNNRVPDESLIRRGYQDVLRGRLEDAYFFWRGDSKVTLARRAWGLSGMSFYQGLGNMADKVGRVSESAHQVAALLELSAEQRETLDAALPIFKADLATQMVVEMPELEGVMARTYALAEGQPEAVAVALEHGARPTTAGGKLPQDPLGGVLAVADRLDTLVGLFATGKRSTGSTDPYGLRRVSMALVRILNVFGWAVSPKTLIEITSQSYNDLAPVSPEVHIEVETFIWERLAHVLEDEGANVLAVRTALDGAPSIIEAARQAHVLSHVMHHEAFPDLLAMYRRVAALVKDPPGAPVQPDLFKLESEQMLYDASKALEHNLATIKTELIGAVPAWDLGHPSVVTAFVREYMKAVGEFKEPLEQFFDEVVVNVDQNRLRRNRLALLLRVHETLRQGLGDIEALAGAA